MGKFQNKGKECSVPMCSSVSSSTRNVTYFSFPSNPYHQKIWAKLISRREKNGDLWMPVQSSKVCSLHFVEADFRVWADYKRLVPNAIPTVFPGYPVKIRKRQSKIIENFRKAYPLGVETPMKPSTSSKKAFGRPVEYRRISQKRGSEDSRCSSESNSDTEVKKTRGDTSDQELNTGGSQVPQKHSEESKPFKKRRIETDAYSNGVVELDLGSENSIQSEGISTKESERPKQANSQFRKSQGDDKLGRGMRTKRRSVKVEYDSEELANDDQVDDDYTPTQNSKRRLGKGEVVEELNELKESQNSRKIATLEQRIRWKEEQMFNLNQKAIRERNARIKAENELKALRNSMKNDGMTVPEGLCEPSDSVSEPQTQEDINNDQDNLKDRKCITSNEDTAKLNWAKSIKSMKEEMILKDKLLATLKNTATRKEKNAGEREPKNRLTRNLLQILEDAMSGDAKALFLLEQIECYGLENVSQFRMSTIKKCIEWKLVNVRGYEAVQNMGILTLPSTKVLRNHVDVLADTGVTATEEVSLENDVAEVMQEMREEGSDDDEADSSNVSSKLRMTSRNDSQSEIEEVMLIDDVPNEGLRQIISMTKRQVKRERFSDSSMEDERVKMKKWFGMKEKDMATKTTQPAAGMADSVKELQTVKYKQSFRKNTPTGGKENADSVAVHEGTSIETVDITDRHDSDSAVAGGTEKDDTESASHENIRKPEETKAVKACKTADSKKQTARGTDKTNTTPDDVKSSGVASEVLHDASEHDYAEPASEDTDPTYMIESLEDSMESTPEDVL